MKKVLGDNSKKGNSKTEKGISFSHISPQAYVSSKDNGQEPLSALHE